MPVLRFSLASLAVAAVLTAALLVHPGEASSRSGGAGAGFAGDIVVSGEARTCTACHGGTVNSGSGSVAITAPATFVPGEPVEITVTVDNQTVTTGGLQGFSAIVKDADTDAFVGAYTVPDAGLVQTTDGNDAYLTHTTAGNQQTAWTFQWTAPADTPPASVIVYAAGNAANGNGGTTGDEIYTTTATIAMMPVATDDRPLADAGVEWEAAGPNPVRDRASATLRLDAAQTVAVRLVDGRGRTVRAVVSGLRPAGASTLDLDVQGLAPGVYFLVAETERGTRAHAVHVVR